VATKLTVRFSGLCGFAARGTFSEVLCHPEKGHHFPTLTIPVKYLDLLNTSWQPVVVGHAENGDEFGVWDLAGEKLALGATTGLPTWGGAGKGLRMRDFHAGAPKTSSDAEKVIFPGGGPDGAVVSLSGGTLDFSVPPSLALKVKQKGTTGPKTDFSSAVIWSGQVDDPGSGAIVFPKNGAGKKIALKIGGGAVWMAVTSVARVAHPKGLAHFHHYYDLMNGVPPADVISLESGKADADVYDCIPPTDLG
jgi:hypothetical protein